jgi:CheY-like chemotaxis protein
MSGQPEAVDQPRKSVLIVEDNVALADLLAQMLSKAGYRAVTASNGEEALNYLRGADRPGLIILDLMMPVMNGWEFRKRQLEDPELCAIPVAVTTAISADYERYGNLSAVAYLTKPYSMDMLLETIREHCG